MDTVHPASRTPRGPLTGVFATLLATVLATVGLAVLTTSPAAAGGRVVALSSDTYEAKVQQLINKRRAQHGLSSLSLESCTDGTAERWAQKLARSHEFYHQSMSNILDRCRARYAGETLGKGSISPHRLVSLWMHSPGHREVLLSRQAKRIGVGAYVDSSGAWVTAANFTRF
jgi:uncharacterized protein YkwD